MNHPTCGALPTHICMQGQEAKSVGQAAGGWQPGKESMRSHGCLNLDLRQGFRVWGFKTPNPKPQTLMLPLVRGAFWSEYHPKRLSFARLTMLPVHSGIDNLDSLT